MDWLNFAPDLKQLVIDLQAHLGAPPWALLVLVLLGVAIVGLLFINWRQSAGLVRCNRQLCELTAATVKRLSRRADSQE